MTKQRRTRSDIERLREDVGTFEAPIGAVQLPSSGVRYDRRGNPKPLQSGQDEHDEPVARGSANRTRSRRSAAPELAFTTDLFAQEPAEKSVLAACHKVLSGRQVTEHELRRKLVAKNQFESAVIERGIAACRDAGLIDDSRYVAQFVDTRVRRGHGAQRIRQDLARRGAPRDLVDAALAEHRDSDAFTDGALHAARTRAARFDLADPAQRAKLQRWLCSRGFSISEASDAVRTLERDAHDTE